MSSFKLSILFASFGIVSAVETLICKDQPIYIQCESGYIIFPTSIFYGRKLTSVCPKPGHTLTNCEAANSLSAFNTLCFGRKKCLLDTYKIRAFTGDPCPGTDKYLILNHDCLLASCLLWETSLSLRNVHMTSQMITSFQAQSAIHCAVYCKDHSQCVSFGFETTSEYCNLYDDNFETTQDGNGVTKLGSMFFRCVLK